MTKLAALAALLPGLLSGLALSAGAAEHVTLKNGFDLVCDRREAVGDRVKLYTGPESFVEVGAVEIASVEWMPPAPETLKPASLPLRSELQPSPAELHELMARAGLKHNLDVDLLASVVRAESGGNVHAVSRTGARGLMQLMPGTATELGVTDSFGAEQNINGGTAYLDSLLAKYHDNLALALAAYNAGPAAVDKYHGIPPYRETRAYVARVIREFNRLCKSRAAHSPVEQTANSVAIQIPTAQVAGLSGDLSGDRLSGDHLSGDQLAASQAAQ